MLITPFIKNDLLFNSINELKYTKKYHIQYFRPINKEGNEVKKMHV